MSKKGQKEKAQQLLSDYEIFQLEEQEKNSRHQENQQTQTHDNNQKFTTKGTTKLPQKLCYIFLEACNGCLEPFLNVFFLSTGLNIGQAATISALRILAIAMCQPCWSNICGNRIRRYNALFWLSCLLAASLTFPMPWIAKRGQKVSTTDCSSIKTFKTTLNYINSDLNPCNSTEQNVLFFVMLSVNIASGIFSSALTLQLDKVIHDSLDSDQNNGLFSQQIYGYLGRGVSTLSAGTVSEKYNNGYTGNFIVYLPTVGMLMVVSVLLFYQLKKPTRINKKQRGCIQAAQELKKTLQTDNLVAFVTIVFVGIADGVQMYFLFCFMEDQGASKSLMGLSIFVATLVASLVVKFWQMYYPKVHGQGNQRLSRDTKNSIFLGISVLCYALNLFFTSIIDTMWLIAPIQILHGIGNGVFRMCAHEHFKTQTHKTFLTSLHRYLELLRQTVGYIIANIAGGVFYRPENGKLFFKRISYLYFILTLVIGISVLCKSCTKKSKEPTSATQNNSQ